MDVSFRKLRVIIVYNVLLVTYFQVLYQNLPGGNIAYLSKMSWTVSGSYLKLCHAEW
jgi:hypothetical protein